MTSNLSSIWDIPENVEILRRMWADGNGAGAIARELNTTRNSIVGKIHRLGMSDGFRSVWTDDKIAEFIKLWRDGLSYRQIAGVLGFSRNTVMGKGLRLKLSERFPRLDSKFNPRMDRAQKADKQNRRAVESARTVKVMVVQKVHENGTSVAKLVDAVMREPDMEWEEFNAAIPWHQRCTLLELTDDTCRWPIGDPCEPGFYFCGGKPDSGVPYCGFHARVAYQLPQPRRDSSPTPARHGFRPPATQLKAFGA